MWQVLRTAQRALRAGRWRDLYDAAVAQLWLGCAQVLVWIVPRGRLVPTADFASGMHFVTCSSVGNALRVARAIDRASRHGFTRPQCLVRAIALQRMLEGRKIVGSVVRIGVRRDQAGTINAHAWVELNGLVLGDRTDHTATFAPLTDVRMAASGRE